MSDQIAVELIRTAPTIIIIVIVCLLAIRYHRQFEALLTRVGSIKAFGFEAEFGQARKQLLGAARAYNLTPDEKQLDVLLKRADRIQDLLHGSRLLWVDDHPLANANIYRFLNLCGVVVDTTTTTDEALDALRWAASAYDVVITDMVRGSDSSAGITLVAAMKKLSGEMKDPGIVKPVIIFVALLDPTKDTPAGALLITDSPIKLLHQVMDVIESGG